MRQAVRQTVKQTDSEWQKSRPKTNNWEVSWLGRKISPIHRSRCTPGLFKCFIRKHFFQVSLYAYMYAWCVPPCSSIYSQATFFAKRVFFEKDVLNNGSMVHGWDVGARSVHEASPRAANRKREPKLDTPRGSEGRQGCPALPGAARRHSDGLHRVSLLVARALVVRHCDRLH